MDEIADVGLETSDVGRDDGEVVTFTGLHDPKHQDGCRWAVLSQGRGMVPGEDGLEMLEGEASCHTGPKLVLGLVGGEGLE